MPQLPPYVRYWADRMWADLPDKSTPIIAAALKHWDDWHSLIRGRVEEIASAVSDLDSATSQNKADKSTTITAGSGLDGGGDLSASRTLSVEWGTGHEQVRRGDDRGIAASQMLPDAVGAGDLLVGRADGKLDRLPRSQPGLLLGSGESSPTWQEPGSLGLGLPAASYEGQIPVSRADGTWRLTESFSTGSPSQLMSDTVNGARRYFWGNPAATQLELSRADYQLPSNPWPVHESQASKSPYSRATDSGVNIKMAAGSNTVAIAGTLLSWVDAASAFYRIPQESPIRVGLLPPVVRPVTEKTFTYTTGGANFYGGSLPGTTTGSIGTTLTIKPDGSMWVHHHIWTGTGSYTNNQPTTQYSLAFSGTYDRTT